MRQVLGPFLETGWSSDISKDHKDLCIGARRGCLKWSRKLSQGGREAGVQRVKDGAVGGDRPLPFPGSWRLLSRKGSLKRGWPLGSPQPACVSSFLRVDSSNIHCSSARLIGAYHPHTEGVGWGRAWEDAAADSGCCGSESQGKTCVFTFCFLPHTSATPGGPGALHCGAAGGWVRGGGRRHQDSLTSDQLMLSASLPGYRTGLRAGSAQAATSCGLVFPPSLDGLDLSPSPALPLHLLHRSP